MNTRTTKGKFITVEGIEGAGKTTQMKHIERRLRDLGVDFVATREPGGTPLGEEIRRLLLEPRAAAPRPLTELLLMFAARAEHIGRVILPALRRGQWALCDRFIDATSAYQGGGRGLDTKLIESLETLTQGDLQDDLQGGPDGDLRPDLVLYLDLPPEQGMARAGRRGLADRFEQEDLDFFHRVRQAYLRRARARPETHRVIDASADAPQVRAQIHRAIDRLIQDRRD